MTVDAIFTQTSRDETLPESRMLGLAYYGDNIISGSCGLISFLKDNPEFDIERLSEGRFLVVASTARKSIIKVDDLAQNTVFVYRSNGYWAISNSLLTLVYRLKKDGVPIKFYRPGVLSFFAGNQSMWGGQPLSLNTLIEGVSILPAGCHLEITKNHAGTPVLKQIEPAPKDLDESNYAERLVQWVRRARMRLEAMAAHGVEFNVGVSGGMDSRLNLGLVNALRDPTLPVRLRSDKSKSQDLPIAEQLAAHYGLKLKGFPDRGWGSSDTEDAYALWQRAYLGVYLPAQTPHGLSPEQSRYILHGGNFKDRSYRRHGVDKRARILSRAFTSQDDGKLVADEFKEFFLQRDIDPSTSLAMDQHYVDTRSRFHTGVHWFGEYTSPLMTPHLSSELFSLYRGLSSEAQNAEQLLYDMLYILDPDLTNIPFDTPDKFFSHRVRASCPFSGRVDSVGDVPEPRIYGAFEQPESPSEHKTLRESVSQRFRDDAQYFLPELKRFGIASERIGEVRAHLEAGGRVRQMPLASLAVTLGVYAEAASESLPDISLCGSS